MRLNEFLEQHLPPYMLIKHLDKLYEISLTPIDNEQLGWNIYSFNISRSDLKNQLEYHNISIKEFEEILQKYGWYISCIHGDVLNLTVENNIDNKYYKTSPDALFKNKYLHITNAKPSHISNKGLIAKNSTDPNVEKDLTMNRSILYPNKRIYLWDLEDASGSISKYGGDIQQKIFRTIRTILYGLHASSYGSYAYIITLPDTIKLHYDNEYGTDYAAHYITQNIPPSYIKYIGTTDRLEEIISNKDYKRLTQILKAI